MWGKLNRVTLFPSFRKAWRSSSPAISELITKGSICRSMVKLFPARLPSATVSRTRSISMSPISSEAHFAAFGSAVLSTNLEAGWDNITSARWP